MICLRKSGVSAESSKKASLQIAYRRRSKTGNSLPGQKRSVRGGAKHRGLQISLSLKIYLKDKMSNNTKITE